MFKRFIPVFVLAAMLPFLIGFLVTPPDVGFFTRADTRDELRIWLEPANVTMTAGSEVTLTVVGSFESENTLIPEISLYVQGDNNLEVSNPLLVHSIPFNGKVELGKITVSALETGKATVTIPQDSIEITAFDREIEINTGSANIVVR